MSKVLLKDGSETSDPRLDRLYELDWRSLDYPISEKLELTRHFSTYFPRSYTWSIDANLDQGVDGACVGFAFTHDLIARPQVLTELYGNPVDNRFAKEKVYWEAQKIDPWDGGSYPNASPRYEGTSVLAGAKVLRELGVYSAYHWALSLEELAIGVGYDGCCILGVNWHEGMLSPDDGGYIRPSGSVVGGHAVLVYGVKVVFKNWINKVTSRTWENVDLHKSYFKIKNSWGSNWGDDGNCYLSLYSMDYLLNKRGDACFPERVYD